MVPRPTRRAAAPKPEAVEAAAPVEAAPVVVTAPVPAEPAIDWSWLMGGSVALLLGALATLVVRGRRQAQIDAEMAAQRVLEEAEAARQAAVVEAARIERVTRQQRERAERERAESERIVQEQREMAEALAIRTAEFAPIGAFIHLLKFIALADRRFGEAERVAVVRVVERCFPAVAPSRRPEVIALLDSAQVDMFELPRYTEPFRDSTPAFRAALLEGLRELSLADGKTTKGEEERLRLVADALG